MDFEEKVKDYFGSLKKQQKEYLLGEMAPLLKEFIKRTQLDFSQINDWLESFNLDISDIDAQSLINSYNARDYEEYVDEISLDIVQELENFFIFFNASSSEIKNSSNIAPFRNDGNLFSPSFSIILRRLALNIDNLFNDKVHVNYDIYSKGKINITTDNSIDESFIEYNSNENKVQFWLEYDHIIELLGDSWEDSLNNILRLLLKNIADICSVHYAIHPHVALDIQIQKKPIG